MKKNEIKYFMVLYSYFFSTLKSEYMFVISASSGWS